QSLVPCPQPSGSWVDACSALNRQSTIENRQFPPGPQSDLWSELQAALIRFQESPQVLCGIEQLVPLLVVERHRKAPQSVDAHAPLVADLELQLPTWFRSQLLLELGNPGHQIFFSWL